MFERFKVSLFIIWYFGKVGCVKSLNASQTCKTNKKWASRVNHDRDHLSRSWLYRLTANRVNKWTIALDRGWHHDRDGQSRSRLWLNLWFWLLLTGLYNFHHTFSNTHNHIYTHTFHILSTPNYFQDQIRDFQSNNMSRQGSKVININ